MKDKEKCKYFKEIDYGYRQSKQCYAQKCAPEVYCNGNIDKCSKYPTITEEIKQDFKMREKEYKDFEENWGKQIEEIRKEYQKEKLKLFAKAYNQGSKETAEKILNELYCTPKEQVESKIKELARFIGVEIKE